MLALLSVLSSLALAGTCSDVGSSGVGIYPAANLVTLDADTSIMTTFCDGSAGYTNVVYLRLPTYVWIARGHVTPVGNVVDIGAYSVGTELVFAVFVRDTGDVFRSGPAERNPDGEVHAQVTDLGDGSYVVGFEDLWGGGDRDFDDINLLVEGDLLVAEDCDDADDDYICDDVDNCAAEYNIDQADADEDGAGDVCDPCPYDPEDDADEDGVCGDVDVCPDTVLPDEAAVLHLGVNRWADVDGDGVFESTASRGIGPRRSYTIEETGGCTCAQIVDEWMLGNGHTMFGCSISVMDEWTMFVSAE